MSQKHTYIILKSNFKVKIKFLQNLFSLDYFLKTLKI